MALVVNIITRTLVLNTQLQILEHIQKIMYTIRDGGAPNRTHDFVCSTANNQSSITHFAGCDNAAACVHKLQIKTSQNSCYFVGTVLIMKTIHSPVSTCISKIISYRVQQNTANKHMHILNTIMLNCAHAHTQIHKHTHQNVLL